MTTTPLNLKSYNAASLLPAERVYRVADVEAAIEQASAPATVTVTDATGWLIEVHKGTDHPCWLTAKNNYTNDASKAFRFARKEDAEAFLKIFLDAKFGTDIVGIYRRHLGPNNYSVTEHMWPGLAIGGSPAPSLKEFFAEWEQIMPPDMREAFVLAAGGSTTAEPELSEIALRAVRNACSALRSAAAMTGSLEDHARFINAANHLDKHILFPEVAGGSGVSDSPPAEVGQFHRAWALAQEVEGYDKKAFVYVQQFYDRAAPPSRAGAEQPTTGEKS